ncbi:uncharacterized protein LTHEOB_6116 [Lasiodiplodia theobromae]|uniref:uncharacterized protein n=1 Tax=Lasiodiplodia theobromae TaxID=45133 RepID=UPI0015C4016D|nr:uncharacterized protein LTHEOB_6116 [Lasiodiplodia theobromae]KAF4544546.1 hypothetical protein LTHEOB_6116 [Lasiodiplodia theobromae]
MEDTRHRKIKSGAKERVLEYVSSLKEIRERTRKLFRNNKLVEMMYVLRDTGLTYLVKRRADGQVVMTPRRRKRRSKRNTGAAKEKSSRHNNSSASTSSGRRHRRKHRHDHQEPYCQYCEDRRERRERRHEHREYRDSLVHHRKHYKHRGGDEHEHGAHQHHEYTEHPESSSVTQPPVESIRSPTDNSPITETERPEPPSDRMTRISDFMAPRNDAAPSKPASYSDKPLPRLPRPERESTRMTRMSDFMAPVSEAAPSRPVSYSDYELPEERLSIFSELHLDDGKREHKPQFRSAGEMGKSVRLSSMASVATFKTSPVDKPSGGQGLNSLIHQELRNGWSSDEDDSSSSDYSDDEGDEYEEGEEEIIDLNGDD